MHKEYLVEREKASQLQKQWVRLTRACNNHCIFCLDTDAHNGNNLPVTGIMNILKKGKVSGAQRAVLSGGEPTLHPEFLDIILQTRALGYRQIQVITNGRMFSYSGFLRQAVSNGLTEVTVSMHGDTAALHDRQTKVPGSFRQSLTALQHAVSIKSLVVNVDIVINKINVRYLARIIRFFISQGVREFDLLQVVPFGSAWKNRREVFYDIEAHLESLREAFSFSGDHRLHIWTNRFPPRYLEGFEFLIQHPHKLSDEIRGRIRMFERMLSTHRKPRCYGSRCGYCYLQGFCADLMAYLKQGLLPVKRMPVCLNGKKGKAALDKHGGWKRLEAKTVTVSSFLDFYIKARYFVKPVSCRRCRHFGSCEGVPVEYLRAHGTPKPIDT